MKKSINLLLIAFTVSLMGKSAGAQELTESVLLESRDYSSEDLLHDTGYRVNDGNVHMDYIYNSQAKAVFDSQQSLRQNMPAHLPVAFASLVSQVHSYIDKMTATEPNLENQNGISNADLAEKIVRASFCFGTDPGFVTSQIMTESTFKRRARSRTGAVGFTQMTGIAIDEVNDQLGNRGEIGAPSEVSAVLANSINCYESNLGKWSQMWDPNQAIPKGKLVNGHLIWSQRSKLWLMSSVDRDLIYGQVILKTYLARFQPLGLRGAQLYAQAAKAYNGERGKRKVIYARKILERVEEI